MATRSGSGPILLCFDGSGPARHALEHGAALLAPAPALVVHVWLALSHVLLWSPVFPSPGPLEEPAREIPATWRMPAGISSCGMNIPEMNSSGRMIALMMGGAASTLGMNAVRANARQENEPAASTSVRITPAAVCDGSATP